MKTTVTALMLLLAAANVGAESGVPAAVHSVTSGGYWEAEGRQGTYRVVVLNSGYEHVTSRVLVEWLQEPTRNEVAKVVSSVEPSLSFGNGVASLSVSLSPLATGQVQIAVSGAVSTDPTRNVTAVLLAFQPRAVRP